MKIFTEEERAINLAKARDAKIISSAKRHSNLLWMKNEYLDMPYWRHLASTNKIRMPLEGELASEKEIRKALRKCKVDVKLWNESYTSAKYFVQHNVGWSAQAVTGLVLEIMVAQ